MTQQFRKALELGKTGSLSVTPYELARLRLKAFELLKDWGSTNDEGKFEKWGWTARMENALVLVNWALGEEQEDNERTG